MQGLEHNFLERCNIYFETMKKLFHKIPVELPKPPSTKEKHQSLLHAIGGGWYMNKLNDKIPLPKKRKLIKKAQEKEDKIKRHLQTANQNCNDWKFHIHWNKLEWVNPRNRNELKYPYCVSSKEFHLKDNNKTAHWVGHTKLKTLDIDGFSKRKKSLMTYKLV